MNRICLTIVHTDVKIEEEPKGNSIEQIFRVIIVVVIVNVTNNKRETVIKQTTATTIAL